VNYPYGGEIVGSVKHWADANPVEVLPGLIRRTMGETADAMVVEFRAEAGVKIPTHSHPNQQIGYVVRGGIEITIQGVTTACQPGDSWSIPGSTEHSAHFVVETIIVECFSPPREDYR
jgi:quercetin dioxygenase-like cupin family protein